MRSPSTGRIQPTTVTRGDEFPCRDRLPRDPKAASGGLQHGINNGLLPVGLVPGINAGLVVAIRPVVVHRGLRWCSPLGVAASPSATIACPLAQATSKSLVHGGDVVQMMDCVVLFHCV